MVTELAHLNEVGAPLVERARRGDETAFGDLVRLWYAQIFRWALARVGDLDDAEDVTQDAVVRLERAIQTYEGRSSFSTWLYQVVGSVALDHGRRRTRRATVDLRHARDEPTATDPRRDRLDRMQREEAVALVRSYFRELPPQQRQVFDLVDLQGHAPSEVSDLMNLAPATVRAHLFRARRAIRERVLAARPELVEDLA